MSKGRDILSETQLFPRLGYWIRAVQANCWWVEAHEKYQKGGMRNRFDIQTSQGLERISFPLSGGRENKLAIQETCYDFSSEILKRFSSRMETNYRNSPFFEYYWPEIKPYFQEGTLPLFELNLQMLRLTAQFLEIDIAILPTTQFQAPGSDSSLEDLRVHPPVDYALPYTHLFKSEIKVDISVLDLLFMEGPWSGVLVAKWARERKSPL